MEIPDWLKADVSRETLQRLDHFAALVRKWNPTINLVSKSSLPALESRHIWDSAQISEHGGGKHWMDLGSGGGFPAIVVAILSRDVCANRKFTLVESDTRKATFLRTAIRELKLNAVVMNCRIEDAERQNADVVSARALTDLSRLLDFACFHLSQDGIAIFMKGMTWKNELDAARKMWKFDCEAHRSKTDPEAAILVIRNISRA